MSLRNRVIIILYIASFTISVFIFAAVMRSVYMNVEYTSYSEGKVSGDKVYLGVNTGGAGRIFRMDFDGKVIDMFTSTSADEARIEDLSIASDGVYAVLSTMETTEPEDGSEPVNQTWYRIVRLSPSLALRELTERFKVDDATLSGFYSDSSTMYLTYLAPDGSYATVYGIAASELKPENELSGGQVILESLRRKNCEDGRFYCQAEYQNGTLYVRTDRDSPSGVFAIDNNIADAAMHMHFKAGQIISMYSTYFIWYFAVLIIWFVVLFLLIRLFTSRNRMFYIVAIAEALLAVIIFAGIATTVNKTAQARSGEHTRFAVISLLGLSDSTGLDDYVDYSASGFYDSAEYQGIREALTGFVNLEGNSDIFYDVLIMRLNDGIVVASASGRNLQHITTIFGSGLDSISNSIYRGSRYDYEDMVIDNQSFRAVAVADNGVVSDYALVGIINDTTDDAGVWVDNKGMVILGVLLFAIGSIMILGVWYLLNRDLRILENALRDTALGKELPERPAVLGNDMKDMWDSMAEINKRVEELQYSKLRIMEAYYRFAPKNIEKILQKNSIIEVRNGDQTRARGTLITLIARPQTGAGMDKYDKAIGAIGDFQKEHGCILIGKSPDDNLIQMFLTENEKDSVEFLTGVFNVHNQGNDRISLSTTIFYDRCLFGVTGTDEETTTYLDADRKQMLANINNIVSNLKLGLIISEDIKEREHVEGPLRFIGFVGCGTTYGAMRLYEVLDACPARIRERKIALLNKFNEALDAFYEKDFYISRTLFSDILKELPDDSLVKWYVFESDRYLNEIVDEETFKNLHV